MLLKNKVWKTRDGKRIPLTDMEDEHLLNAHRLTKEKYLKTLENISFCFSPYAPGEDSIAYQDMESALDDDYVMLSRLHFIGETLRQEIDLRCLQPKKMRTKHQPLPLVKRVIDGRDLGASGGCMMELEHQPEEEYDSKIPF